MEKINAQNVWNAVTFGAVAASAAVLITTFGNQLVSPANFYNSYLFSDWRLIFAYVFAVAIVALLIKFLKIQSFVFGTKEFVWNLCSMFFFAANLVLYNNFLIVGAESVVWLGMVIVAYFVGIIVANKIKR